MAWSGARAFAFVFKNGPDQNVNMSIWPLIGTPFHHNPTPNNVCNSYNAGTSQKEVGKLEILFSSAEGGTAGKNIDHCLSYFVIDCQEEKGLEHAVHSWDEEGPEKAKS